MFLGHVITVVSSCMLLLEWSLEMRHILNKTYLKKNAVCNKYNPKTMSRLKIVKQYSLVYNFFNIGFKNLYNIRHLDLFWGDYNQEILFTFWVFVILWQLIHNEFLFVSYQQHDKHNIWISLYEFRFYCADYWQPEYNNCNLWIHIVIHARNQVKLFSPSRTLWNRWLCWLLHPRFTPTRQMNPRPQIRTLAERSEQTNVVECGRFGRAEPWGRIYRANNRDICDRPPSTRC